MAAMTIRDALARVVERQNLSRAQMTDVMTAIMGGECTDAQIGGLLLALRMKGETVDEITAAVEVMRRLATPVRVEAQPLIDIVGTGGDGANLFNVSTAASFVAAAAGAHVAKHGNRGVSSASGSADALEALGISVDLDPDQVARSIREIGIGFMFAPAHHGAMRYAIGPRRELGLRTIFNILGPMTNPAGVKRQLIGVFDAALCRPVAEVLNQLASEHVLVVHSDDGLDELSLAMPTRIVELRQGKISEYSLSPADVGLVQRSLDGLVVADATESARLIRDALNRQTGPHAATAADVIAMNAGAACYIAGLADNIALGVELAQDMIASGLAWEKCQALAAFCDALRHDA